MHQTTTRVPTRPPRAPAHTRKNAVADAASATSATSSDSTAPKCHSARFGADPGGGPATAPRVRCTKPQPLAAAMIPGALLSVSTTCALTGFSTSTLYRRWGDKSDNFPKPIRFGARCTRVKADALMAWLKAQQPAATE